MKTNRVRQRGDNISVTWRGGWALLPVIRSRASQNDTNPTELASVEKGLCTTDDFSKTAFRVVQKPKNHRDKLGGVCVRAGTTLTEVLVSLLIMSIGVMQVMSLFPIATLRTLEANKQTVTTVARFNIETLVDVDPQFVHNPDAFFPPGAASDLTPYNGPTFRGQTYLVDPLGWQGFNYDPANPANPQAAFPIIAPFPTGNSPRDWFGNNAPAAVNWALPRRYTGASLFAAPYPTTVAGLIAAKVRAAELMVQPDNWKLVTEGQREAGPTTAITSVTLDGDTDLSSLNLTLGVGYRVVIFDIDGNHSETRPLVTAPVGQVVSWLDPLPTRFEVSPNTGVTPNIGKVRIEVADQVYSSMLSVRKRPSGSATIDVVVFFKRNFDFNHERVFEADFRIWDLGGNGVAGGVGDDNGANGTDDPGELGYTGSDDLPNAVVTLKCPSTALEDEHPKPRKGGYIYDTKNGLWYRIRAVQNQQFGVGPGSNEDWVDVVLDESIKMNNTEDLNNNGSLDPFEDFNGDTVITRGGAIVHTNVANVFPLEIKVP